MSKFLNKKIYFANINCLFNSYYMVSTLGLKKHKVTKNSSRVWLNIPISNPYWLSNAKNQKKIGWENFEKCPWAYLHMKIGY